MYFLYFSTLNLRSDLIFSLDASHEHKKWFLFDFTVLQKHDPEKKDG